MTRLCERENFSLLIAIAYFNVSLQRRRAYGKGERKLRFLRSLMNLSFPTSLSHKSREEQREIKVLAPLSVSKRGWGRGEKRACRTHVILIEYDDLLVRGKTGTSAPLGKGCASIDEVWLLVIGQTRYYLLPFRREISSLYSSSKSSSSSSSSSS
ncbi:hypothetical protein NSTCB13_00615 [Nostoc sp. DSM 114160]|jgi:hypothetical protein